MERQDSGIWIKSATIREQGLLSEEGVVKLNQPVLMIGQQPQQQQTQLSRPSDHGSSPAVTAAAVLTATCRGTERDSRPRVLSVKLERTLIPHMRSNPLRNEQVIIVRLDYMHAGNLI